MQRSICLEKAVMLRKMGGNREKMTSNKLVGLSYNDDGWMVGKLDKGQIVMMKINVVAKN